MGSRAHGDRRSDFDTPTLIEVWRTAPYMHDGHYATVEELLTTGNHGRAADRLDRRQLADLAEFVLSL